VRVAVLTTRCLAAASVLALAVPLTAQGPRGSAPPGTRPAPTSPVTGNAARGKELYSSYGCYACHGYSGETGRAFVGNWRNLDSEQVFLRFLRARANLAPTQPSNAMPSFAESTMSDAKAKDIYAHIRTFKSSAPELREIPTLNQIVNAASRPYKP
jgi:mono/diheme cytochrome c family protein